MDNATHKIQVLGSGCSGCKKLHGLAEQAAKDMGLDGEVEYVTDVTKLIELGIMQSPALTVDGKVVLSGFIPDADQVREAIEEAVKGSDAEDTGTDAGEAAGGDPSCCSCGGNC